MFRTPLSKVILILILFITSLYISLPKKFPVKFQIGNIKIDETLVRKDLNITSGKLSIKKSFDLVLGLDLAGGSHLVFEADTQKLSTDAKKEALDSLRNIMEKRVNFFGVSEPNVLVSSFNGKDRVIVELPGVKDTREAISIIGKTAYLIFAEVGTGDNPGIINSDLTGSDLKRARVDFDNTSGKPVVGLEFNESGANKFEKLTEKNVDKPLAIILDDKVVSAPVVQQKISGGTAQITGNFSLDEAKNLVAQLNAGALPVPVKVVEERTVGATLGSESVRRSVIAGMVGLFMVLVFMILSYGKFGLIADMALIIFGALTLALYKLIPVVLTLPGVAGFLLSVGMAVDSNILIFERFKEEITRRNFKDALEVSFGRAWDSIRDANIATLVTAFILANPFDWSFLHVSGPVRGFAITLSLGVLIGLFTGIVVSRNMLRAFLKEKQNGKK